MKNSPKKNDRNKLSFGELIATVSSCASNKTEMLAALLDLFESGRVRIKDHGHLKRVRFSIFL